MNAEYQGNEGFLQRDSVEHKEYAEVQILKHLKKLVNQSIAFLIIAEGETVSAVAVSPQPLNIVPNLYALQFLADIKRQTHLL